MSFWDTTQNVPVEEVRRLYERLPLLDHTSMEGMHGISSKYRHAILEDSLIEVMKNPGWLKGPEAYQNRDEILLDGSDLEWLTEDTSVEKARSILENFSNSVPIGESQVQSIIIRSLDLLSQRHTGLAMFRCHIFDSMYGIEGFDFSFGSVLSSDIQQYALPTAFPVLAILPLQYLVELYKSRSIHYIASEGNWARDSMEIHPASIIPSDKLFLYRIVESNLETIDAMIDSPGWKIEQY